MDGRSAKAQDSEPRLASFRHDALFYSGGDRGFVEATLELVRGAVGREAGVLVAVDAGRAAALSEALGEEAESVRFADVREIGRNPARIIPAWQDFVDEQAGRAGALAISEASWPGRSEAELAECERHDALVDLAFAHGAPWRVLCAYDREGLAGHTIEAAARAHSGAREPAQPLAGSLPVPAPAGTLTERPFGSGELSQLRHAVSEWATAHAMRTEHIEELVLAVDELATNSIRHGGGSGTLRCWREGETLVCEVQDLGWIDAPMVGRRRPDPEASSGRGVWLVNQLCDLVQIRSAPTGTVVRVHKRLS
jgi:anti-sigma regulatory factor (Ser/Thr protein kinase)